MVALPYVTSPGNVGKALKGIKDAAVPERVNQDFVKTILKIPGGSGDQITSFLKKIGFAATDATPTELYTKFRNPTTAGAAVASAIKTAYAPLYVRNEFAHALSDDELLGLIVEETGQPHDANAVKLTQSTFKALKNHAKFDAVSVVVDEVSTPSLASGMRTPPGFEPAPIGLNLGYTININLPATSDQAVFNAIFRAIKQNLLTSDDA